VRIFQERRRSDQSLAKASDAADADYARERDVAIPITFRGPVPMGGVAGTRGGVKCLHAHLAHHLAGRANPIGAEVAEMIGQLDCDITCWPAKRP
jgi:hypothetical protein